jgi:hypothetical protein
METLKEWIKDKNLKIVIGDPSLWGLDTKDFKKSKKLYAYSYFDESKNCWIEPTRFFQYIDQMHYNIKFEVLDRINLK